MKRLSAPLFAIALGLVLSATTTAQAGNVTFTYDFTPTDLTITGDAAKNWIDMTNQTPNTVTIGSGAPGTDIVAANLSVHNGLSDTFNGSGSGVSYTLKLKLTDGAASVDLAYTGHVSGSITNGAATLTNVFDTPHPPPFVLNGNTYDISMTSFVSPNPYNPDPTKVTKGAIGFHVTAIDGSGLGNNDTPEPSTLLLSCLGLGGLGLRAWRKRRLIQA